MDGAMKNLTVVMPTYNQSEFVVETVNSIIAQTYTDFDLVVVNDASTDLPRPDFLEYITAPLGDRVKVVHLKTNRGTGYALNAGFLISDPTQYETWWASDNVMAPQMLERLVETLEETKADYAYSTCDIHVMEPDGQTVRQIKPLVSEVGDQTWDADRFWHHYFLGICWMWRRELRMKTGGLFQLEPCEDYDMVLRMVEAGGQFVHLPENLGWFRRHMENMTHRIKMSGIDYSEFVKEKARKRRGL